MIDFKYFEKPEAYVGLRDGETVCDTCRQLKLCFDATTFYGMDDLNSICPDCLAGGKLADKNAFTCEGDIGTLREQLIQLNPNLNENGINALAENKTFELEKTTPHLVTWQDWSWPASDGDYCKFIGYGSKPFYKKLANSISAEDFFENSFYDSDSYSDDLWSDAVSDKEIKNYTDSSKYSTLFYVFKSLNSGKIITIWDCD